MISIKASPAEQQVFLEEKEDYYSNTGCCLTCSKRKNNCLCYYCKCKKCKWYREIDNLSKGGLCEYVGENATINSNDIVKGIKPEGV